MSNNAVTKSKQVLQNPVSAFNLHYPEAEVDKKAALEDLQEQMQLLKDKVRELDVQAKITSRKIGEAKKYNQPTEQLITAMRTKSAELRQFEEKLEDIENQILAFFADTADESKPKPMAESLVEKRYRTADVNVDEITISLLGDDEQAWNDYVVKHPQASIHHLAHWRHILEKTYGITSFYFYAQDMQHQVVGVLPLVRLKSRLFGDMLVSMPYFQCGGAIADHPDIENELMKAASEEAARLGVDHIEYRDDIPREGMPVQSHKVNMVLSLPDSEQALWNGFTAKLRAQINRPQQLAPEVFIGGREFLDDFYKVYSHNMRDLGSPAHSQALVENILRAFPDNSWIVIIRMNNTPVSAGLLLGFGDTMEIPLASTVRKVNPHSMNMLLYWEVLKHAIKQGYRCFDFGRSSKGAGTYRFKKQWGAEPKQLHWHYWMGNSAELPSLKPSNPKYALIINTWKRLPVMLTRWLGPMIVKNIP